MGPIPSLMLMPRCFAPLLLAAVLCEAASLGASVPPVQSFPAWQLTKVDEGIDEDLAIGKPAGATSLTGPDGHPMLAVDDNPGSAWQAANTSSAEQPQWLVVDLGVLCTLSSIEIVTGMPTSFALRLQGSNTNVGMPSAMSDDHWDELHVSDESLGVAAPSEESPHVAAVAGVYRFVRVVFFGPVPADVDNPPPAVQRLSVRGSVLDQPTVVPPPVPLVKPAGTPMIGMQMCNLWANKRNWRSVADYPERRPLMGMYDEARDVVTDYTVKMLVDHGVDFMMGCWYRLWGSEGQSPVLGEYDHTLNSLANTAAHRSHLQWAGIWVPMQGGGVAGMDDFLENMAPFFIDNWFSKPNYLKLGGKPVLPIFGITSLVQQLGGAHNLGLALAGLRAQVEAAGFPGLELWVSSNGDTKSNNSWAEGFDHVWAYHLPSFTDLSYLVAKPDDDVIEPSIQQMAWDSVLRHSTVPTLVTASVGWDSKPWGGFVTELSWQLDGDEFGQLLGAAAGALAHRREVHGEESLAGNVLLLDNWNEMGEGHAMQPTEALGYTYLTQVAAAFYPGQQPEQIQPNLTLVPQIVV